MNILKAFTKTLRRFAQNTSGTFAISLACCAIPVIAVAGGSVDYVMWMSARDRATQAADAAALAAAVYSLQSEADMRAVANGQVALAMASMPDMSMTDFSFDADSERVNVEVSGTIPSAFVMLVGIQTLPVKVTAQAERAAGGSLELALVLDNTWSMSDSDGSGSTKIAALKTAAVSLVNTVTVDPSARVSMSVVPYADYVNVGTDNRAQPWLAVPADYSTTSTKTCVTKTTKQQCTKGAAKTCTRVVDGVSETYDCTPQTCVDVTVPAYESCSGGGTTNYKWYGCVRSRNAANLRLSDDLPLVPYVGFLGTSRACLNPIVPLTTDFAAIRTAINGMIVNSGSYKPLTHIPSGMVWGINVLSPTAPFTQGDAYDADNFRPRKALVLMTDGDNTLRFNVADGSHATLSSNATTAANQKAATDSDTSALCTYAKSKGIEIFTVAFGTLQPSSSTLLSGCASGLENYYVAASANELRLAFERIGKSLTQVRLTR